MTKYILLFFAVVTLSGCSTVSSVVGSVFGLSCEKQVALASEANVSTAEIISEAIVLNKISESQTDEYFDKLRAIDEEIRLAGSQCALNEGAALESIDDALADIETIKGEL